MSLLSPYTSLVPPWPFLALKNFREKAAESKGHFEMELDFKTFLGIGLLTVSVLAAPGDIDNRRNIDFIHLFDIICFYTNELLLEELEMKFQ